MAAAGHAGRVLAVLDNAEAARSAIAASWRRCLTLHRLDPEHPGPPPTLTQSEMAPLLEAMAPVLRAADSVLDRLFLAVGAAGACVLLTDASGVPVARRGEACDDADFHRAGLWTGALWSEAGAGTNGIGTALAEQRPLSVHRDQHFHTRHVMLSCTVSPIYDEAGRLCAALDVSTCRRDFSESALGLVAAAVADAARRIEAQVFRQGFPAARIVLLDGEAADRASRPLIAVDADDRVVGATRAARLALGITDETLALGLPAADLIEPDARPDAAFELVRAERSALRRALARTRGNVSAAAAALRLSRATLHRKLRDLSQF